MSRKECVPCVSPAGSIQIKLCHPPAQEYLSCLCFHRSQCVEKLPKILCALVYPLFSLREFSPHMMSLLTQSTHREKHPGQLLNLGTAKFYFDSVPRDREP